MQQEDSSAGAGEGSFVTHMRCAGAGVKEGGSSPHAHGVASKKAGTAGPPAAYAAGATGRR